MSDFFKNLKRIFIVEEPAGHSAADRGSGLDEEKAAGSDASAQTPEIVTEGKVASRFVDVLLNAMEKSNLDGIDYLEFRQSLDSLSKIQMDEATRYKSAFAMAKTMGVQKEKLIESAAHYLKVLEAESGKFDDALKNQVHLQIEKRGARMLQLQEQVAQWEKDIEALREKIAGANRDIEKLAGLKDDAAAKVEQTKADFQASWKLVRERITEDVNKMREFLA